MCNRVKLVFLPPAYVVRREGTVFTGVCLSTGGGGCQPSDSMGGGVSGQSSGGDQIQPMGGGGSGPAGWGGQVQPGGGSVVSPAGGISSSWGGQVQPTGGGGGGQVHGGWYASCVHAGGLSCES